MNAMAPSVRKKLSFFPKLLSVSMLITVLMIVAPVLSKWSGTPLGTPASASEGSFWFMLVAAISSFVAVIAGHCLGWLLNAILLIFYKKWKANDVYLFIMREEIPSNWKGQ